MTASEMHPMVRVQIAMWIDGDAHCAVCGHIYKSVDDFIARNPKAGSGFGGDNPNDRFVDDHCWGEYVRTLEVGGRG